MKTSMASSAPASPGVHHTQNPASHCNGGASFSASSVTPSGPASTSSSFVGASMVARKPPRRQRRAPERREYLVGPGHLAPQFPRLEQQAAVETVRATALATQCFLDRRIALLDRRLVAAIPEHRFGVARQQLKSAASAGSDRQTSVAAYRACEDPHRARRASDAAKRPTPPPAPTRLLRRAHGCRSESACSLRRAPPAGPGCRPGAGHCGTRRGRWAWRQANRRADQAGVNIWIRFRPRPLSQDCGRETMPLPAQSSTNRTRRVIEQTGS